MVKLHLQGMGLLGSLTAWQLINKGVDFTWSDNNSKINAWRACTGACYPSNSPMEYDAYKTMRRWCNSRIYPAKCLETCAYWVDTTHKSQPHGWLGDVEAEVGGMRLVGKSVHVNAQRLVPVTRDRLVDLERDNVPTNSLLVVSHGFSKRRKRYLWGWTRLIKLKYDKQISKHGRPSFYLRKSRFQFAYCYPVPHTEWWYAGSNLISQTNAKSLDIESKYKSWKDRFIELSGGAVQIAEEGAMIEGWRPAKSGSLSKEEGHKAETPRMLLKGKQRLYYPVLASGGFRHFPELWRQLADELGIKA